MAKNRRFTVQYRRKRNKQTDYGQRLKLLKSKKPRLVIRKNLNNITAQITEYTNKGDKIIVSAYPKELRKLGWKFNLSNLPSSYLLGLLIGKKAKEKNIDYCILDIGLHPSIKGSSVYALLKGALDSGLKIPHNEKNFPDEKRITGQHISEYAKKIRDSEQYKKQFSYYIKNHIDMENIIKEFEKTKSKLLEHERR